MSDPVLLSLGLLAFLGAALLTERLQPKVAWVPLAALCTASFLVFRELGRWDHGHAWLLNVVGFIGAPIGAILGGAAWGSRRFYGWPDLGPHLPRLALWCASILLGVLLGVGAVPADVAATQQQGEALRARLLAWREAHGGAWPRTLEEAVPDAPRTRIGGWNPPPFELVARGEGAAPLLRFAFSATRAFELDLGEGAGGAWRDARRGAR